MLARPACNCGLFDRSIQTHLRATEAKAEVGHGEWLPWLKDEFDWSRQTADRYMAVAIAFQSAHAERFDGLTIDATALYALAAPDVPQGARDEAIKRAETGERITREAAQEMVTEAQKRRFVRQTGSRSGSRPEPNHHDPSTVR
jgi:hypothetical protein